MVTREEILEALKEVYDPEIPVSIVDLGLVYGVETTEEGDVHVRITLTAPGCPLSHMLVRMVEDAIRREVRGVRNVRVEVVWDPPWTPERISERGRAILRALGFSV